MSDKVLLERNNIHSNKVGFLFKIKMKSNYEYIFHIFSVYLLLNK